MALRAVIPDGRRPSIGPDDAHSGLPAGGLRALREQRCLPFDVLQPATRPGLNERLLFDCRK